MIGTVDRLTWRGVGVVSSGDATVHVPCVLPGERVEVEPQPDARVARLVRVIEPADARVDPECDQAAGCPGCPLRHVEPAAQRAFKRTQHEAALTRFTGLELAVPIAGSAPRDGYRSRARARPRSAGDEVALGLNAHPGHAPIDLRACPAQTPGSRALLDQAQCWIAAAGAPWAFAPDAPGVLGVEVDGRPGDGRVSLLVSDARWDAALAAAAIALPGVHVSRRCLGARGPGPSVALAGPASAGWTCDGDHFRATHPAWRPHSPASLPQLRTLVLDALEPAPTDTILEIGCGVGTLSLPIARRCSALLGIDLSRQAAHDATANARAAGLTNAEFQVGEGDRVVRRLLKRGRRFDRIVVHMMRRPLGGATVRQLALLGAERLVYVAPSVASLGRDLAARGPWQIDRLVGLDQLPGTVHLLTICQLSRSAGAAGARDQSMQS